MLDLSMDAEPDVNGCLNWLGAVTTAPITWDSTANERVNVRQLLWEQAHGPLPEGAELGCCCQNPRCVELTHMDELVEDGVEVVEVQAPLKKVLTAKKRKPRANTKYHALDDIKARCRVAEDGCWIWLGALSGGGHGRFGKVSVYTNGVRALWNVHRLVWVMTHGETPRSVRVLHSCEALECVNPDHLYARAPKKPAQ